MTDNTENLKIIYFLGIGGIGMSALARYFNGQGVRVYGYDKTETELTIALENEGIYIHYEDKVELIPEGIDLVIFTPAIPPDLKELNWFLKRGFPLKKRAEVLGMISRAKKTIAVAGTHGKTTTSSIVTHLLHTAGEKCAAFLGGIALNFESNFVEGEGDWVVVEADEFDRSFLHLNPDLSVIMSMDPDHLDIYGTEDSILESGYKAFARKSKPGGKVFVHVDFAQHFENQNIETIGLEKGDYRAENVRVENGFMVFDIRSPKGDINDIRFTQPGRHNVLNATAAIALGQQLGIGEHAVREAMQSFKGIRRRFEILVRTEQVVYIDDYAHHPTELQAAIDAARMFFPGKKLTGIFQPHLFSRTRDFSAGFAKALDSLDEVLLLEIYPARELPIPGITSETIFNQMKNTNRKRVEKENLISELEHVDTEVLLTLGAGDIDTFREPIRQILLKKMDN